MFSLKAKLSSFSPMLMAIIFAVSTYWLTHHFQIEAGRKRGESHEPDYIVHQFRVQRYNEMGFLSDTLYGQTITHYGDDSTASITFPRVQHQKNPEEPLYLITADSGEANQITRVVELSDNVRITQKTKGHPDTVADTPWVEYDDKKGLITAPKGVVLHQQLSNISAQQLLIDTRQNKAYLSGNINGILYPN